MLNLRLPDRVFLFTSPTDMRKSFDGLAGLVRLHLGRDPLSGDLFVFRSKRGDRVKLLFFEPDGFCLFYKRLEEGTFHFPSDPAAPGLRGAQKIAEHGLQIHIDDLALLLDGIDLASIKRRKRYQRGASAFPNATPSVPQTGQPASLPIPATIQ